MSVREAFSDRSGLALSLLMSAAVPTVRRRRLIRELQAAYQLLQAWENSLRCMADPSTAGLAAHDGAAETLLTMVKEARVSIQRRLDELGMGTEPLEAPQGINPRHWELPGIASRLPPEEEVKPGLCLSACRACGHALGAAFREAQAVADSATAFMIYRWLRAFEKHLWVLDPGQARQAFPLQPTGPAR